MEKQRDLDTRFQVVQTVFAQRSPHQENHKDENCCVICLEHISEQALLHPCRHSSFDFFCLISWLGEQSLCPLCKAEVETVHYDIKGEQSFQSYSVHSTDVKTQTQYNSRSPRYQVLSSRAPLNNDPGLRTLQPYPSTNEALLRRRHVYAQQLFSLHVGTNRISRFRDLNPNLFASSPELNSRARKWIRRELQVFEFLGPGITSSSTDRRANNAEFLLEYVVAILKTVDIRSSTGQAEEMLMEFLGRENARLFLHELGTWLRSPYTRLEDWDRQVQYLKKREDRGYYSHSSRRNSAHRSHR